MGFAVENDAPGGLIRLADTFIAGPRSLETRTVRGFLHSQRQLLAPPILTKVRRPRKMRGFPDSCTEPLSRIRTPKSLTLGSELPFPLPLSARPPAVSAIKIGHCGNGCPGERLAREKLCFTLVLDIHQPRYGCGHGDESRIDLGAHRIGNNLLNATGIIGKQTHRRGCAAAEQ